MKEKQRGYYMKRLFLLIMISTLSSYSALANDVQPIKCSDFITHLTNHLDTEDSFRLMAEQSNTLHPKYLPPPPLEVIKSTDRDFFDKTIAECRAIPNETLMDSLNHNHTIIVQNISQALKIRGEHYRQIAETAKDIFPKSTTCQNVIRQHESNPELLNFPHTVLDYMLVQPVFGGPGVETRIIEKYMNIIISNTLNSCKANPNDLFYPIMHTEIQKQTTIAENTVTYP